MATSGIQNRLKSKVFWVSVLSGLALIARAFGFEIADDATITNVVNSIFGLLVLFGIANNPTDKDNF